MHQHTVCLLSKYNNMCKSPEVGAQVWCTVLSLSPTSVVHTLSSFNLYEDAIREPLNESDELSDAISDPTTQ